MNIEPLIAALREMRLNAADTNVIVQAIGTLRELEKDNAGLRVVVDALQVDLALAKAGLL